MKNGQNRNSAISGIADHSVLTFSRLRITPDLGDDEFPEGEYSFEWKVINNNGTEEPVVIGSGRDLDYEVTLTPGARKLLGIYVS